MIGVPSHAGGDDEHRAGAAELRWMFVAAVALRIAVFVTMTQGFGYTLRTYTEWVDGKSYLWMAQALAGSPPAYLREYDHRAFPGFSMLLAFVYSVGLPLNWTALVVSWTSSGLAAVFGAKLFNDRRMGWALVTLTPQYVMNSSMVMTEGLMMACMLGGLLLVHRKKPVIGGLVSGFGGLVRPMVAFSVLGRLVYDWRGKRWKRSVVFAVTAALMIGTGLAVLQWRTGDATHQMSVQLMHPWAYGGRRVDWPFHSMIVALQAKSGCVPILECPAYAQRPDQLAYFLFPVPIVLFACIRLLVLWRRDREGNDPLLRLVAPWLWGNTLFALSVPTSWALTQFGRFILVALPPLVWAYRPLLPRRPFWWVVFAILSYAFAVITFCCV